MPIPYFTEDAEAMRRQGHLDVLKVDFAENQPSSNLCAPNAQRCDQAYDMRIKCRPQEGERNALERVVGNTGVENIDLHPTMSDESSGRPRGEKG
jgi:hypothetical protein